VQALQILREKIVGYTASAEKSVLYASAIGAPAALAESPQKRFFNQAELSE
jgi:hypothetical protein